MLLVRREETKLMQDGKETKHESTVRLTGFKINKGGPIRPGRALAIFQVSPLQPVYSEDFMSPAVYDLANPVSHWETRSVQAHTPMKQ